MSLSIIVAMSENRTIGQNGDMPWRLSADLRRFRRLTMDHTIVMGRKTYESIGRLLPGRATVIVSRQRDYRVDGAKVVHELESALNTPGNDSETFVIGGGEIYRLALPLAQRLYLTRVHVSLDGDTHFPELDFSQWTQLESERVAADEKNDYDTTFEIYERISAKW